MTEETTAPKKLTRRQRVFIDEYLKCFNATKAAIAAGYSEKTAYSIGQRLLKNVEIKAAVDARLQENHMSADEALGILAEQSRAKIGTFFKLVEEWTFYPLPTYEIIDAKEVIDDTDPDNPKTRVSYWVRHVVIDLDKVMDPNYSGLLQEFSDNGKDGMSIKMYNKQAAIDKVLRAHGRYVDRTEVTGKDGKDLTAAVIHVYLPNNGRNDARE
jgi:phage terminase small subunit